MGQHLANSPTSRRTRGRAKGSPKPPGSGRKPGTPNHVTRDVREATQKKGAAALRELWKLCTSATDEKVRKAALDTWLSYAFGRPVDRQEITGKDGEPFAGLADPADAPRRIAFLLAQGAKEAEPLILEPRPRPAPPPAEPEVAAAPEPQPEPATEPPADNVVNFPEARAI